MPCFFTLLCIACYWKMFQFLSDHGPDSRSGHTPSSTPDDANMDFRSGSAGPQYANPNLLPPEYYTPNSYANGEDHYDNRRPTPRRIPASISSSDNNSDTTYAESGDINNSLRARMHALDNRKYFFFNRFLLFSALTKKNWQFTGILVKKSHYTWY